MLTPQNFREKTFERAIFGGYDMGAVDDFLEEAANDYAAVAKENMVLKSKMKVLVEKIEEYRSTEDTMRMTLLSAQKLCTQMEQEARERSDGILADAKLEAERIVRDAHNQRVSEEARLLEARKESSKYIEDMHLICTKQLSFLESLESYKLDAPRQDAPPAAEPTPRVEDTVRSIEDSVERLDGAAADGGDREIGRVVADGAAAIPEGEGNEPTRMFSGSAAQNAGAQYSFDSIRYGK